MPSNSLRELTKRAEVNIKDSERYSVKSWINTVSKLYKEGSDYDESGNLDNAYVCYMKGCSIMVEIIAKHSNFIDAKKDPLYVELERLTNDEILDNLNILNTKLRARDNNSDLLNMRRVEEKYPPMPTIYSDVGSLSGPHNTQASVPPSVSELSLDDLPSVPTHAPTRKDLTPIPPRHSPSPSKPQCSVSPVIKPMTVQPPAQVSTQPPLQLPMQPPLQPSMHLLTQLQAQRPKTHIDLPAQTDHSFPKAMIVEPKLLAKWITKKDNPPSILILDVRPRDMFVSGCIKHKWIAQIEPLVLRKNVRSTKISASLVLNPDIEQQLFEARHKNFDLVVYYDQDSNNIQDANQHLRNLKSAIYETEFEHTLPRVPMMLAGGFNAWKDEIGERGIYTFKKPSATDKALADAAWQREPWSGGDPRKRPGYGDKQLVTVHHTLYDYFSHKSIEPHLQSMSRSGEQHARPPLQGIFNQSSPDSRYSPIKSPMSMPVPQARPPVSQKKEKEPSSIPYPDIQPNSSIIPDYESGTSALERQDAFIDNPFQGFTTTSDSIHEAPVIPPKPTRPLPLVPEKKIPSPALPRPSAKPDLQLDLVRIGTTGLKNLGNTCYMNSIIQCLSGTIPFARYFIAGMYMQHTNSERGTGGVLAEKFSELLRVMWGEKYNSISPVTFREALVRFAPQFTGTDQQDSQEFLMFLLDGLHEDLNIVVKRPPPQTENLEEELLFERLPDYKASKIKWENQLKRDASVVVSLFQGQYRDLRTCLKCKQTSTTYGVFMSLSLPIPENRDKVSLYQCLDKFEAEEVLKDDNARYCSRCQKNQPATKCTKLSKLPDVLLIHLSRFSCKEPSYNKLDTDVDFPTKGLDLSRYIPETMFPPGEERPSLIYDLYAVSNHYGTLTGGHYTACVKNGYRGKWHYFDDTNFSVCDESKVKTRAAYNLFYVRSTVQGRPTPRQ